MSAPAEITELLHRHQKGDDEAMKELFALVYQSLRQIARAQLQRGGASQTLQPTALVHEAFLKLMNMEKTTWEDRSHFFGVAAKSMRRILIDYARRKGASKRGGEAVRVVFDEAAIADLSAPSDLLQIDAALTELFKHSERLGRVVELRFFGGLTAEESAEVLKVSAETVRKDWRKAKVWLHAALQKT